MRVDIWSDVVCPFVISEKRLEHMAAKAGIELEVHWHGELDQTHLQNAGAPILAPSRKYGRIIC